MLKCGTVPTPEPTTVLGMKFAIMKRLDHAVKKQVCIVHIALYMWYTNFQPVQISNL